MWGLDALLTGLTFFGDTSSAITSMREYVMPVVRILSGLAGLACVFFIVHAGYLYITSSGKPDRMEHAKELNLDMEQFKADIVDKKTTATINADLDEVKRLGGTGTPTFALNGKKIDNPANTPEAFSALLDQALEESE